MIAGGARHMRWALLLVVLAGAGWLALFGDKTPAGAPTQRAVLGARQQAPVRAATAARRTPAAANGTPTAQAEVAVEALLPREQLLVRAAGGARRDLFASPPVPRPPPPVVVPVPAPVAPPLPCRAIGKKLEAGTWEVFLGRDETSFLVRVGSVLESNYRVDKIEPPTMVLTHLPTRQQQTLSIGDAW